MATKKDFKESNELKKFLELNSLLKIVSILFILSITVLSIVNIFERKEHGNKEQQNTITITGHGELNVRPDTTKFTISVIESGVDIKTSQNNATTKINEAIAILKENGIAEQNIKTLNFSTYPKYSSRTISCASTGVSVPVKGKGVSSPASVGAPTIAPAVVSGKTGVSTANIKATNCVDRISEIVGYETNQSIEVKIKDISKNPELAGILVTAVGKVGVETSGLTNYVDDMDNLKQLARELAIQKAKAQVKDLEIALGVKLGKITSFSENVGGGYPYSMMMSAKTVGASDSAVANLPVGENTVTSDVSITYSIR